MAAESRSCFDDTSARDSHRARRDPLARPGDIIAEQLDHDLDVSIEGDPAIAPAELDQPAIRRGLGQMEPNAEWRFGRRLAMTGGEVGQGLGATSGQHRHLKLHAGRLEHRRRFPDDLPELLGPRHVAQLRADGPKRGMQAPVAPTLVGEVVSELVPDVPEPPQQHEDREQQQCAQHHRELGAARVRDRQRDAAEARCTARTGSARPGGGSGPGPSALVDVLLVGLEKRPARAARAAPIASSVSMIGSPSAMRRDQHRDRGRRLLVGLHRGGRQHEPRGTCCRCRP